MITLYEGSGAKEIQLLEPAMPSHDWERLRGAVIRLLERRGEVQAAGALRENAFALHNGTNGFGDEFHVLYLRAAFDSYVAWADKADDMQERITYRAVASAVTELGKFVRFIAVELDDEDGPTPVSSPNLEITSDIVERALSDAERLIATEGATSGVDRVHTAFHGYLHAVLEKAGLAAAEGAPITELFKLLRERHPGFQKTGPRHDDVNKVVRSLANVIDSLNPIRNLASVAHPNKELLDEPEAMLVINSVRTLLHYLNKRTRV